MTPEKPQNLQEQEELELLDFPAYGDHLLHPRRGTCPLCGAYSGCLCR